MARSLHPSSHFTQIYEHNHPNGVLGTVLDGQFVYTTAQSGVHIISVTDPFHPADVDSFDMGPCVRLNLIDSSLYVFKLDGTINRWNVSDPRHPQFEGTTVLPAGCNTFIGSDSRWCSPLDRYCSDQAVVVLDPSNPAVPVEVSRFGRYGHPGRSAVSGNVLCVADGWTGLRTFDLSNPQQFHELGHTPCTGQTSTFNVAVLENYVYRAVSGQGLYIYDLTNPALPESVGCWQGAVSTEVSIHGDSAYVGCTGSYIAVLSLANPMAPQRVDTMRSSLGSETCPISNGYMYCGAESGNGFGVYSLADPMAPQLVGWCFLQGNGLDTRYSMAAVSGNYCFVAAQSGGVNVVDVSNPYAPQVVSMIPGSWVTHDALSGQTLIYYDSPRFYVMDVSSPTSPQELGHYNTGGPGHDIADMRIAGQHVVAVNEGQVSLYQVDALDAAHPRKAVPYEFALRPAYPNPFNPTTVIAFSLPKTEHATLIVYDVTGREVTVLTDRVLEAGDHRVTFDGSALASGVYFARLEAGKKVKTEKLMLLK